MRVSLKQNEITAAIVVYLAKRGLANVRAEDLNIKYTTTRVGADAGISADFDIPEENDSHVSERRVSGQTEAPVAGVGAPVLEGAKPEVAESAPAAEVGNTSAGGYVAPAEDAAAAPVAEVAEAAEPAPEAGEQAAEPAKGESLFD